MRERRGVKAVSTGLSALLFSIMGGVIAVCSVLAGLEPAMVRTGLVIYAFIAGPIFLVGAISRFFEPSKHRSFRATLSYMEGKRVKPRLQLISCITGVLALSTALGAFIGTIALGCTQRAPGGLLTILLFGSPLAAYFLTVFVSKWVFVRLGWMTVEEASGFLSGSRRPPDSWLESVDEGKPATRDPRSIVRRTYLAALVAMLVVAGALVLLLQNRPLPGGLIVKGLLVYGAAAAAYFGVVFALKRRCVRLGVMSREQAEFFPSWSRRWPESWLEPANKAAAKDADKMPAKTPESETRVH